MKIIIVEDNISDIRIDKYLINKLDYSRSKIQKLIKTNNILVNNKEVKNNSTVKSYDKITINIDFEDEVEIKPEKMNLNIIYEDEYIIAINKPSGMVTHPSLGHYSNTLVNGLLYYAKYLSNINKFRPGIVHRLDKDTSGLLLIAKNNNIHLKLVNSLKKRQIKRKYIVLVHKIILHNTGTINAPVGRDIKNRQKMTVTVKNSKEAITHFKVITRYNNTTLIECELETGRTHQIRVHMQYIGHPIVNDPIYGHNKLINNFGQMLHAKTITFNHPITNKYMEFNAPIPTEFNKILNLFKILG